MLFIVYTEGQKRPGTSNRIVCSMLTRANICTTSHILVHQVYDTPGCIYKEEIKISTRYSSINRMLICPNVYLVYTSLISLRSGAWLCTSQMKKIVFVYV